MDNTAIAAAWIAACAAVASAIVAIVVGRFTRQQATEARLVVDSTKASRA